MKDPVLVLMSTYNGTEYLEEQLRCILDQTYDGPITVLIRDDGSRDGTVKLAESLSCPENRKILVCPRENVGPQRSFLELIRMAEEASYYFFADQDDVWDLDKIQTAVALMAPWGDTPVAACSNYRLSDMDLAIYDEAAIKQTPRFTPLRVLLYNEIPGCCMGFNHALMTLLKVMKTENVMMHDSMALSLAALTGEVLYDPQPRIIHRIHRANVVGDGHKKIVLHKWIPEKLKLLMEKEDYDLSLLAEDFLSVGKDQIRCEYRADAELLRDFKKSWGKTVALLRHPDSQGRLLDRTALSIRCKILFRLF